LRRMSTLCYCRRAPYLSGELGGVGPYYVAEVERGSQNEGVKSRQAMRG
jgi:hypothetical protein